MGLSNRTLKQRQMAREIGDIQVKIYAYKQRIKELKEELKKSLSKKIWALK